MAVRGGLTKKLYMKKKSIRITIDSIDELNGTLIFATSAKSDGKKLSVVINGQTHVGTWEGGKCWIKTGKALGSTYSISF